MNNELMQAAATVFAGLLAGSSASNVTPEMEATFISIYRHLEAAKARVQEEDQAKKRPMQIPPNASVHGGR